MQSPPVTRQARRDGSSDTASRRSTSSRSRSSAARSGAARQKMPGRGTEAVAVRPTATVSNANRIPIHAGRAQAIEVMTRSGSGPSASGRGDLRPLSRWLGLQGDRQPPQPTERSTITPDTSIASATRPAIGRRPPSERSSRTPSTPAASTGTGSTSAKRNSEKDRSSAGPSKSGSSRRSDTKGSSPTTG
jgi:hypothetical protein